MNGTSMAAPHVAGAVAILISGLKALGLPYSPYSVKRALENSATYLDHVEPWAQGCGLVNVEKAFEVLREHHDAVERDVTFTVAVQGGAGAAGGAGGAAGAAGKGVLLRPRAGDPARDVALTVEPQFLHSHCDEDGSEVIRAQLQFGCELALCCAADWVAAPRHLALSNAPRPLSLRVDTAALPPGAHFTSINAYDVRCVSKGPVFRVPVTVLQPEPLPTAAPGAPAPALRHSDVTFRPATVRRHFVDVPEAASWAVLRLWTRERGAAGRFLAHAMQLVPRRSCRTHEAQKMLSLSADAPAVMPFQLVGGIPLEIVITKYWANLGDIAVDYSVEFHGLRGDFGERLALGGAGGVRAVLVSALAHDELQPSAQLKHAEAVVRPSESKLVPLTARDVVPPARQIYQLVNTYNFHVAKATEVTPIVSMLSDTLYESELESQMWMLYNCCKQLLAVGDAYPAKYCVKLEKGDYVLRLNVRHESRALLERLRLAELPLVVQQRLPQPITLDAYATHAQAVTGGKKFSSAAVVSGAPTPVYFTGVPPDKISRSNVSVGYVLSGSVTFAKDELGRKVDSYPLLYAVVEPPKRSASANSNSGAGTAKDKDKAKEEFADAHRDFLITWIAKLEGDKLEQVYAEAAEKFPAHVGVHVAYLQALDPHADHKRLPHAEGAADVSVASCEHLLAAADKVIKQIDQEKLLAYLGMKTDTRPDASKIKQDREKQRGWLVEALCRRGAALARLAAAEHEHEQRGRHVAALADTAADLLKYTDLTDTKAIHFGVWHAFTLQHWGRAAKLLNKLQEERPSREVEERLIEVYGALGWAHLAALARGALPARFPAAYRPF